MPYLKIAEMNPVRRTSPTMIARGRKATMKSAVNMGVSVRVMDGMLRAVCDVSSRMNSDCGFFGGSVSSPSWPLCQMAVYSSHQIEQECQFPVCP